MTQKFIEEQLKDLEAYLDTINENRKAFQEQLGEQWVVDKIDEILDTINEYKILLNELKK